MWHPCASLRTWTHYHTHILTACAWCGCPLSFVSFFFFAAHVVSLATHAQRVGPWRSSNAYMHMLKDGLLRSAGPVWLWLSLVCCDHCDFTLLFLFEVPPFFFSSLPLFVVLSSPICHLWRHNKLHSVDNEGSLKFRFIRSWKASDLPLSFSYFLLLPFFFSFTGGSLLSRLFFFF